MKYVDSEQMRRIDAEMLCRAYKFPDVPSEDSLIKLASLAVSGFISRMCGYAARRPCVHIIFGSGNNGADAVYAGLDLADRGFRVRYYAAFGREKLSGALARLDAADGMPAVNWCGDGENWTSMPPMVIEPGDVIVDGILGIGSRGAPHGRCRDAIECINRCGRSAKVVSVDVPSGLDADTGTCPGVAVAANYTVCMGMPKKGMKSAEALRHSGSVYIADLGMVAGDRQGGADEMVSGADVARMIPVRRWDANKGDFGYVCVVGGAMGFCGAPALAAMGALRAGAGLTGALVPRGIVQVTAAHLPEAMVWPVDGWSKIGDSGLGFGGKTLVVGPGMTRAAEVRGAVRWLVEDSGAVAAVLDADALNAIEDDASILRGARMPLVLTPHPGEAARLLGMPVGELQADRAAAVRKLADMTGAAVILKGAGTLVSAPGKPINLVPGVNPGMASGGMGDVLAGIAGALLARGLEAFDAACAAAWIHSCAGDIAAWRLGQDAMLATDVAGAIGEVMSALA